MRTTWQISTKTGRFCAILYHVPASWSWLHQEECFQTHWLLLLWLQRSPSQVDWWIYWGYHLVTEHIVYIRSWENIHVYTDVVLDAVWPLYQFLREVITKKRIAWFDPCLRTVAVRPWYVPLIPNKMNNNVLGMTSDALPYLTSRCQAFTLLPYDFSDSMEEAPVSGISWGLVMDKFDLERQGDGRNANVLSL